MGGTLFCTPLRKGLSCLVKLEALDVLSLHLDDLVADTNVPRLLFDGTRPVVVCRVVRERKAPQGKPKQNKTFGDQSIDESMNLYKMNEFIHYE